MSISSKVLQGLVQSEVDGGWDEEGPAVEEGPPEYPGVRRVDVVG